MNRRNLFLVAGAALLGAALAVLSGMLGSTEAADALSAPARWICSGLRALSLSGFWGRFSRFWWAEPYYRTYRMGDHEETLLRNNHAVLLCGYDSQTDQYNVADPYNVKCQGQDYFYWQDASVLEPLYLVRQHAVVVR